MDELYGITQEETDIAKNSDTKTFRSVSAILKNSGSDQLFQSFDDYYSHADMCYESTYCQLLEPDESDEENGSGSILICYNWVEQNDTN